MKLVSVKGGRYMVITEQISFDTKGFCDQIDITKMVQKKISECGLENGIALVFVPGSTGAITTMEYEGGLRKDIRVLMNRLVPEDEEYAHNLTWGDGNGFSHVRSSLVGTSFAVPVVGGRMQLGTWQQIVFLDFDNRPRSRSLVVQVVGE
ncbi:MAG: secondary thiamine-phosphate synthase enzyme YjbQ [bacterium]